MDDTRTDHDVADDVITVIMHLADRLRQTPRPDYSQVAATLEIIEEAVSSERSRCRDAWIHSLPGPSEEATSPVDDLPF